MAKSRLAALDSLRGIAALSVVATHVVLLRPLGRLHFTPFALLANGHGAVLLFFVLSGFALHTQMTSVSYSYAGFALRRIFRIYPPYAAAIVLSLSLYAIVGSADTSWLGSWFATAWPRTIGGGNIGAHFMLLGSFQATTLDPVVWSLVYEMRLSLLFPLIFFGIKKGSGGTVLAALLAVDAATAFFDPDPCLTLARSTVAATLLPTWHYALMFVAGALLSKHQSDLAGLASKNVLGLGLLVLGIAIYACAPQFWSYRYTAYFSDWMSTCGASAVIAGILISQSVRTFLEKKVLLFFGKISYSLYLVHNVIIISVFHFIYEKTMFYEALAVAGALLIPVSYLSYRYVESPFTALGKKLAAGFVQRTAVVTPFRQKSFR